MTREKELTVTFKKGPLQRDQQQQALIEAAMAKKKEERREEESKAGKKGVPSEGSGGGGGGGTEPQSPRRSFKGFIGALSPRLKKGSLFRGERGCFGTFVLRGLVSRSLSLIFLFFFFLSFVCCTEKKKGALHRSVEVLAVLAVVVVVVLALRRRCQRSQRIRVLRNLSFALNVVHVISCSARNVFLVQRSWKFLRHSLGNNRSLFVR